MRSFEEFLKKLLDNPGTDTTLEIRGRKKIIKGMARFKSINYDFDYLKICFNDHSHLIIVPDEKDVSYSEGIIGEAEGVTDEMIGSKEINYLGKKYVLVNGNDYQFCVRLYVGKSNEDIEGEVKFSDYVAEDDEGEMLSLGWIVYTGERADVLSKSIDIREIEIL